MVRIAVTGGIACGKSVVGSFLADEGVAVCEADELAHELMKSGRPVFRQIVRRFGKDILGVDGAIDRKRLALLVFSDSRELAALNAIVHPETKKAWNRWLGEQESVVSRRQSYGGQGGQVAGRSLDQGGRSEGKRCKQTFGNLKSKIGNLKAVIVPLLYEAGEADGWDVIVCVSASEALQMQRLKGRGISEAEAKKRIGAQSPVGTKAALADYVIINNGTKDLLREQTVRVMRNILENQTWD